MIVVPCIPQLGVSVKVKINDGQLRLEARPSAPEQMRREGKLANNVLQGDEMKRRIEAM